MHRTHYYRLYLVGRYRSINTRNLEISETMKGISWRECLFTSPGYINILRSCHTQILGHNHAYMIPIGWQIRIFDFGCTDLYFRARFQTREMYQRNTRHILSEIIDINTLARFYTIESRQGINRHDCLCHIRKKLEILRSFEIRFLHFYRRLPISVIKMRHRPSFAVLLLACIIHLTHKETAISYSAIIIAFPGSRIGNYGLLRTILVGNLQLCH